jgi:hypothetical protein
MMQYREDIEKIEKRQKALEKDLELDPQKEKMAEQWQLEMQLNTLKREKAKCEREWQLQKLTLITNLAYAVGLMLAFVALTLPGPLGVVGAVVCLALTVINNAIKNGIELYKTQQTRKEIKEEYKLKVDLLREKGPQLSENERKLLYLEIMQLSADSDYQKQMMIYQASCLVRKIMLDVLIPALVFASLVFAPLVVALPVLGAVLGIAVATYFLFEYTLKPKDQKELEFDQQKYDAFYNGLQNSKEKKTPTLFQRAPIAKNQRLEEKDLDSSMSPVSC